MRALAVSILTAITVAATGCLPQEVRADGFSVPRVKKIKSVRPARKCGPHDQCGFPVTCPSGSCYSLYGAYGPYGGQVYWSRFSYSGWGFR
jgi:hypothetical protein